MTVRRTQYWNVSTHTVRTGATAHGESLVDLEEYLLPLEQARGAALHAWGVATGLEVSTALGTPRVTVATGVALDVTGRTIVLVRGGVAVVDPAVDPTSIQDVPTVQVEADGVTLGTAGAPARCLLTVTWREVMGENTLAGAPALLHAPWLRLVPLEGDVGNGDQVVLAELALDDAGAVTELVVGPRRLAGSPVGRVELSAVQATPGPDGRVGQDPAATLAAESGGDVILTLAQRADRPALRVSGESGDVELSGALRTAGLTVEGQVHTGGASGGLSFAGRDAAAMVATPHAGERWVWYAVGGEARLWSGEDLLRVRCGAAAAGSPDGASLDVFRRMRVRSNGIFSAGIWFHQDRDRGFVGMADDAHVGFYGAGGAGWGLAMDTASADIGVGIGLAAPAARLHVDGSTAIRASGRTSGGGGGHLVPILFPGVGVEASGDIGVRSTGRVWAGQFVGDVSISGTLSKGGGGFVIDHPLEPATKLLQHSFVESPEMVNIYTGRVTTGSDGLAWVDLPDYFQALNRDVTYQLTVVGAPADVAVAEEVTANRFAIRSEPAGVAVCWLVTGVRQDRWAEAHRIVAEVAKDAGAEDRYLHPELHGAPDDRSILQTAGPADGEPREEPR